MCKVKRKIKVKKFIVNVSFRAIKKVNVPFLDNLGRKINYMFQ